MLLAPGRRRMDSLYSPLQLVKVINVRRVHGFQRSMTQANSWNGNRLQKIKVPPVFYFFIFYLVKEEHQSVENNSTFGYPNSYCRFRVPNRKLAWGTRSENHILHLNWLPNTIFFFLHIRFPNFEIHLHSLPNKIAKCSLLSVRFLKIEDNNIYSKLCDEVSKSLEFTFYMMENLCNILK